jgi:hypothetical protein
MNADGRYPPRIKEKTGREVIERTKGGEIGPETWAPKSKRASSAMFRSKTDREIFPTTDTPAPNAYQHERKRRTEPLRAAFGQGSPRWEKNREMETPGPGQYEGKPVKWAKGSAESSARRAVDKNIEENGIPGPGSYEVEHKREKERASSAFASGTKRGKKIPKTPGPADYNVKTKAEVIGATIHASRFEKSGSFMDVPTRETPAPDAYQKIPEMVGKGRSMSRTARFDERKRDTGPGPTSYEVPHGSLLIRSHNIDFAHIS